MGERVSAVIHGTVSPTQTAAWGNVRRGDEDSLEELRGHGMAGTPSCRTLGKQSFGTSLHDCVQQDYTDTLDSLSYRGWADRLAVGDPFGGVVSRGMARSKDRSARLEVEL